MINSILLPLLSITILQSFFTPSLGQSPKLCPVIFPLPDGSACGNDGDFRCIDEALKTFPASKMNQKCSCSDSRPKGSQCQCTIVCDSPPSNSTEINLSECKPFPPCVSHKPCPYCGSHKTQWPELVGVKAEVAKAAIKRDNPFVLGIPVKCKEYITFDFCCNRVWIRLDCDGKVYHTPTVG